MVTLDRQSASVIERCLANGNSVEVKIERNQIVIIELGRKLKSKVPIDELNSQDLVD